MLVLSKAINKVNNEKLWDVEICILKKAVQLINRDHVTGAGGPV